MIIEFDVDRGSYGVTPENENAKRKDHACKDAAPFPTLAGVTVTVIVTQLQPRT